MLVVVFLLSTILTSAAYASGGNPVGSCPPGFDLTDFMDHTGPHMHSHIGLNQDLNGDGFICMKIVSGDMHLHVDNYLPLP